MTASEQHARAYERQLVQWSNFLSIGHGEKVLDDLTDDSRPEDIERFLENAIGERYRLLAEEMSFVALAFDYFDSLLDRYLRETPRRTFVLGDREQPRFLAWLRTQNLTPQQSDYVAYQEAEYACYQRAQRFRTAYVEFQTSWSDGQGNVDAWLSQPGCNILLNPVWVWTRLEIAQSADADPRTGDVVLLANRMQIRSLWLTESQIGAARTLVAHRPATLEVWMAFHPQIAKTRWIALVKEFVAAGLISVVNTSHEHPPG